ncbi:membrane protein required for colicin V production [Lacinutrix venerupis]|uniref:Colicin V production protein n=1 Tax=Lacinutrix venerupis TaxID=1486034 RepID=A0AAC9LK83_9FLAO|nr:CvpA family protein [Lacinutrix venerupis]APX99057.1 colicin V production protein [Lacinutrix venerupis]RLJ65421.1 membrane protein required for colicin V production [Lacinutrix venerupis]
MAVIDIVLGALLLFGLVRGFLKGLFVEVASLVSLVAGVYGAIHFSYFVADFLQSRTEWAEKTINITAFAITFVIIILVISLAGKAFTKLADFASLGILNKLLGGVFGALKIGLILSVLLIVFNKMNNTITFVDEEHIEGSILYEPVKSIAPIIFPTIIKSENDENDINAEDENKV